MRIDEAHGVTYIQCCRWHATAFWHTSARRFPGRRHGPAPCRVALAGARLALQCWSIGHAHGATHTHSYHIPRERYLLSFYLLYIYFYILMQTYLSHSHKQSLLLHFQSITIIFYFKFIYKIISRYI